MEGSAISPIVSIIGNPAIIRTAMTIHQNTASKQNLR